MDDGNGLTPVSLTREYPVTKLVVNLSASDVVALQILDHLSFCIRNGKSVDKSGINKCSCCNIGINLLGNGNIASCNNFNYRKVEFLSKIPVSFIMCGNGHDCTGSVAHKYIIGNPDGNFFIGNRVCRGKAFEFNTGLVFCKLCTLEVGLLCCFLAVCNYFVPVLNGILVLVDIRMLGAHYHIGRAEKCIASCCINGECILFSGKGEFNLGTGALSDPVLLLCRDSFYIVNAVETFDKLLGILCDLEHPLALNLTDYFASAPFADSVDNLFVCKADLT